MATDKNIHIPSLDGIRALAAMSVFAAHVGLLWDLNLAPGGFGVTIFFFLSGYLITTLLRLERERSGTISFRNFYLRRVFRIFPPMYLVLAFGLMLAITGVAPSSLTPGALLAQLGHMSNYYIIASGESHIVPGTGAMWSLAVEEHFYLLYPLLLTLLLKRFSYGRTALVLLALCGVVLLWRCYLIFGLGLQGDYTYMATDTRFDSLLYGCIMGIALNPALDPDILDFGRRAWLLLLAAATAVLAFCFIYRSYAFRETFRYSIQGIALFPVFFCAIRYAKWPIFSWLNLSWIRGLGLISYTFYLIHLTAIAQAADLMYSHSRPFIPKPFIPLIAFAAAVAFSVAMYYLVERRMSVLRHKLHR